MARGRPQHTRGVHQIAVRLDADRKPSLGPVGERGADRRRRTIADAVAAWTAQPLVIALHCPEPLWGPIADIAGGDQRPVEILDPAPQLHAQARRADRARVPCHSGRALGALATV